MFHGVIVLARQVLLVMFCGLSYETEVTIGREGSVAGDGGSKRNNDTSREDYLEDRM